MTHMTISKARNDFADVLNRVAYGGERIVLQRRGKKVAAIIPIDELNMLERIVSELEDEQDIAEIRKVKRDIARRGTISWDELKKKLNL